MNSSSSSCGMEAEGLLSFGLLSFGLLSLPPLRRHGFRDHGAPVLGKQLDNGLCFRSGRYCRIRLNVTGIRVIK